MSKCCVCVAKATRKSQSPYKASHPAPGTRERRKRTQHSQGFSPNKILPLVGGWCCWHGGTQRGQAVCMQVLHYQPALHPHFQLDLVSIPPPGYCTGLYKQRDTSTDWWKNLLHQRSHKWKCLSEEKEGKMNSIRENSFPSTQWSPHTYQLMARHRFFKLAIICSPNFNKFVSSWKRTCQLRDMQHWWTHQGERDMWATLLPKADSPPSPCRHKCVRQYGTGEEQLHTHHSQCSNWDYISCLECTVSSCFSFSDDNLSFYFCLRLPVVEVLFHVEHWNAFAQKEQKLHHYLEWINACKNPNNTVHFNLQNGPDRRGWYWTEVGKLCNGGKGLSKG